MEFNRKSSIMIDKKYFGEKWVQKIKQDLFVIKRNYQDNDFSYIPYYQQTEDFLLIPRYYPIENFIKGKINIIDENPHAKKIKIKSKIKPRSDAQKKLMEEIVKYDNVILQSPPGSGKTIIIIQGICTIKEKTIILTHRDFIVRQWKERLLSFTDIKEENIGILKRKTYKDDLKKPIIISTVQQVGSLLKIKDFRKRIQNSGLGLSVYDELHTTVGAPTFSICSLNIFSKRYWGASATPFNATATERIIKYHFKNIIKNEDAEGTTPPNVYIFLMDFGITKGVSKRYLYWNNKFQRSRYIKQIRKSDKLLNFIKKITEKMYKNGRKIILFGEQHAIIDKLFSMIPFEDKSKFIINSDSSALDSRIIFSTTMKCRDALDCPSLDSAIIFVPIRNIEQLCGRISRNAPGKKEPLLIDIVDIGCSNISRSIHRRIDFYEKRCGDINIFNVLENGKIEKIKKSDIYNILKNTGKEKK